MEISPRNPNDGAPPGGRPAVRRAPYLALASIAGIVYFAISVLALHVLRPEYDPTTRYISEYAVGPYGSVMTVAFFALGLGSLLLAIGIAGVRPVSRRSRAGAYLLALWSAGVLVAGTFPADLIGSPLTTSGAIHDASSVVAFFALIAGAILFSSGVGPDSPWYPRRRLLLRLAFAVLAGFLVFLVSQEVALGIGQRIFVSLALLWLFLAGVQLRRIAVARPA